MSAIATISHDIASGSIFRQLLDSHPTSMLVTVQGEGLFSVVNKAAARLLRLDEIDQVGLRRSNFVDRKGRQPVALDQLVGSALAVPATFKLDDRPDQPVELSASSIVFDGTAAVLLILRDTTMDIHRPPDREAFLEAVLENLPVGVFVKDMQDGGRYVLFNRASGEIAGEDPKDIIGALDSSCGFAALADQFRKEDNQVIAKHGSMTVSEAVIQPDGSEKIVRTVKCALQPTDRSAARFVLGISYDITESRALEGRLAHLALHDGLTGLANRDLFMSTLHWLVADAAVRPVALFCLDIDHFKSINDRLGHQSGDAVLREVGRRLAVFAGSSGIAARVGGDEFIVAVPQPLMTSIRELANQLYRAVTEPFVLAENGESITVSVGVVLTEKPCDLTYLEKSGDLALYAAKAGGRARCQIYDPSMRAKFDHRENLIVELRKAISQREFIWHYQPIVNLAQNRIAAFEALIRWQHPFRGLLRPGEFIEIAEQSGQICMIGELMFEEAFRAAATWPDDIRIALNLSVKQLENATLVSAFGAGLLAARLPATRVEIEVTESIFLSEHATALATLEQLKAMGTSIAIDDFGTGYSSLSYLSAFRFDKIKLDRGFVSGKEARSGNDAIIAAVAGIAKGFDLISTAEGVETSEQRDRLALAGFDEAQGYLLSAPVAEDQIPALIDAYRR